jgi:protease-4
LKVNQNIQDRSSVNPYEFDFFSYSLRPKIGLNDILKNLEKARTDSDIKGIFLDFGFMTPGISTQQEIREALEDFKSSGKFIIAYANTVLPQSSYYLATVADEIYVNPVAIFDFKGLRSERIYYKKALEKIGIEIQVLRHGKFKSAVEPYLRDDMSDESREQTMVYMGSIWDHILTKISESRSIPIDELNDLANNLKIQNPEDAHEAGLIDGVIYQDELIDILKEKSEIESSKKLRLVESLNYSKVSVSNSEKKGLEKNKIAIVYATGVIGMSDGTEYSIGGPEFVNAIRTVRKDSSIKAIVLRVNSPGGSALISEHIWREVYLAQKEKPVIGSMGSLAASGGYYILAPADTLVCHETTLTGSIGVFGTIPNAKELLNDKLGITFDVAKTNTYADFGSLYRPLKPAEREYLQSNIENTYEIFLKNVSEGRNMPTSIVDSLGQGRVWSGINAIENGLADVLGGLNTAIEIAAEKADIEKYRIVEYPKFEDPLEKLLKSLTMEVRNRQLKNELGKYYIYIEELKELATSQNIQMRLPYSIDIY